MSQAKVDKTQKKAGRTVFKFGGRPQLKVDRKDIEMTVKCLAQDPAERARFVTAPGLYLDEKLRDLGHPRFPRSISLARYEMNAQLVTSTSNSYLSNGGLVVSPGSVLVPTYTVSYGVNAESYNAREGSDEIVCV